MEEAKATETKATATFVTSKLAVIGWMQIHLVTKISWRRIKSGRRPKLEFTFDNTDGKCDRLYEEYLNSKACLLDNRLRELKRLLYGNDDGTVRD